MFLQYLILLYLFTFYFKPFGLNDQPVNYGARGTKYSEEGWNQTLFNIINKI